MSKLRLGSGYIPLTDEDMSKDRLVVPFSKIVWLTVSLPFFAFLFCIIRSVTYNFEHATATHCQVYNLLPSVSAAIGHYTPQKDVWKAAITLQAISRALVISLYYRYYKEHVYKQARTFSHLAIFTNTVENISLVTLSYWTSDENYAFHKLSFITFLITSFIHMILAYYVMSNCRSITRESYESKSLKWKQRFLISNVISVLCACYFFYRHNKYCEPLVYSMFALSEYAVVLSNMGFHSTAAWDFPFARLMLSRSGIRIV